MLFQKHPWFLNLIFMCLGGGGNQEVDFIHFFLCQIPPLPYRHVESDVHDPDAFEDYHPIAQKVTHPSDLSIYSLR